MIEPYVCPVTPNPNKPVRKQCRGEANDSWRHRKRGEVPCPQSKKAAAFAKRRARRTGLWVGGLGVLESEDDLYRKLLTPEDWDRWEAQVNLKTTARRPKRFTHEEFYGHPRHSQD